MLPDSEKKKMMQARSIGPKTVDYLEAIGIESLAELKDESAEELCLRIDDYLGKQFYSDHSLGIQAMENLIEHALEHET